MRCAYDRLRADILHAEIDRLKMQLYRCKDLRPSAVRIDNLASVHQRLSSSYQVGYHRRLRSFSPAPQAIMLIRVINEPLRLTRLIGLSLSFRKKVTCSRITAHETTLPPSLMVQRFARIPRIASTKLIRQERCSEYYFLFYISAFPNM